MHKVDEVRREFEAVQKLGAHNAPHCIFLSRAYMPYVKPYIDNDEMLALLDDMPATTDALIICMYVPHMPGTALLKTAPLDMANVFAAMTASALVTKAMGVALEHQGLAVLAFHDDARLDQIIKQLSSVISKYGESIGIPDAVQGTVDPNLH